jgi:hypothetical protein
VNHRAAPSWELEVGVSEKQYSVVGKPLAEDGQRWQQRELATLEL